MSQKQMCQFNFKSLRVLKQIFLKSQLKNKQTQDFIWHFFNEKSTLYITHHIFIYIYSKGQTHGCLQRNDLDSDCKFWLRRGVYWKETDLSLSEQCGGHSKWPIPEKIWHSKCQKTQWNNRVTYSLTAF